MILLLACAPDIRDLDHDGVIDDNDACASTTVGAVVNLQGCSVAQTAPCAGSWKNHGAYVSAVAGATNTLSLEVMNFLKSWLVKHIQGSDKAYTAHLNAKGVK